MANIKIDTDFLKNKKLSVALSGGIDSMVLCHVLQSHNIPFVAAHVNYQLRGEESQKDQKFVETFCLNNQIQLYVKVVDTTKLQTNSGKSMQMIARDIRYQWFHELLQKHHLNLILTAHHWQDSIETFLMLWLRGTGLSGLLGVPKLRGYIFRPLHAATKQDILKYANAHQIEFREDLSNLKNDYKRNFIRNKILPLLHEIQPQIEKTSYQTYQNLAILDEFANHQVNQELNRLLQVNDDLEIIKTDELLKVKGYEFILYHWLKTYEFEAWHDVFKLPTADTGKMIFSATHQLLKNRNDLILSSIKKPNKSTIWLHTLEFDLNEPIKISAKIVNEMINVTQDTIYLDADLLHLPLEISLWQAGDYFYPYKGNGKKKLSKFFKDLKLSRIAKENILILKSNQQIVWVINYRADQRFMANQKTSNLLKIQTINHD